MSENTGNSRIAAEATFSLWVTCYYLLSLVQSPSSDQTRLRSLFIVYLFTCYPHCSLCWFRPESKVSKLLIFCSWKSPNLNSESVTMEMEPVNHSWYLTPSLLLLIHSPAALLGTPLDQLLSSELPYFKAQIQKAAGNMPQRFRSMLTQ